MTACNANQNFKPCPTTRDVRIPVASALSVHSTSGVLVLSGSAPVPMGNSSSSARTIPQAELPAAAAAATASSPSPCPVVGDARPGWLPHTSAAVPADTPCPAAPARRGQPVYNVYNQRIDEGAAASATNSGSGARCVQCLCALLLPLLMRVFPLCTWDFFWFPLLMV